MVPPGLVRETTNPRLVFHQGNDDMNDTVGGALTGHGYASAGRGFDDWLGRLEDADPEVRAEATEVLEKFGPRAEQDLEWALEQRGYACLRLLIAGVDDTRASGGTRSLLHVLFQKAPNSWQNLTGYQDLLEGLPALPGPARWLTALCLVHLARDEELMPAAARQLLPCLGEALSSAYAVERKEAALCLTRMATLHGRTRPCLLDEGLVRALTERLSDEDAGPRYAAAWALEKIGPAASSAIPALQARLSDPRALVRRSASWALESIQDLDGQL